KDVPLKEPKAPPIPEVLEAEAPTTQTASDILKSAAKSGVKGLDEVTQGLYELFGGSSLKSFPGGLDKEAYAKAKPHFDAGFDSFVESGKSLKDFVKWVVDSFGAAVKPYLMKWVGDKKAKGEKDASTDDKGTTSGHDRDSDAGKSPKDVSKPEGKGKTKKGSEAPGTGDDGGVPGSDSRDNVKGDGDKEGRLGEGEDGGKSPESGVGDGKGKQPRIPERGDYRISDGELTRVGGWKKAADNNLDAIELYKKIVKEDRPATEAEKAVLVKYVGWGASELANNMFPGYASYGAVTPSWTETAWKPQVERLISLLTPAEIKTAVRSTQYAHYTSENVIKSIYKALQRMGFKGGNLLEPGTGIGHFVGLIPEGLRSNTKYTGVEMDATSAGIAQLLYPNHNIIHGDYIKQTLPDDFFDGGIGNPPFRQGTIKSDPRYRKHRLSLHNYFIAKTLDKVKPGGTVSFVVSRYAMDAQNTRMREYVSDKADFLGAIRLPQTAFKKNAGTDVVTDVLFLRKRHPGGAAKGESWMDLAEIQTDKGPALINEYFAAHPEMVLGEHALEGSMYGKEEYTVTPMAGDIEAHFDKAVENLPKGALVNAKSPAKEQKNAVVERDFNPANKKEGGLYVSDKGVLMKTNSGSGVPLTSVKKLSKESQEWLKGYVKVRDALKQAHYDQLHDKDWEKSLKELNKIYDAFVKKHGEITEFKLHQKKFTAADGSESVKTIKKFKNASLFELDEAEVSLVYGIENITDDGDIVKGHFLSGRTINAPVEPKIENIHDAIAVTLNDLGRFDLSHAANAAKITEKDAIEQLGDLIYEVPGKEGWTMADEYLSGNVVKKLEEAKVAEKADEKYKRNVKALTEVQPLPLTTDQISVGLGANWVPIGYYNDFASEVLGLQNFEVRYDSRDASWEVIPVAEMDRWGGVRQAAPKVQSLRDAESQWGTAHRGANEILKSVFNNTKIKLEISNKK
ncbi:MAG: hypothetical protein HN416_14035, partial [Nitrospina sp.]|nr:hypothetical protein [Nitrospina sp.]